MPIPRQFSLAYLFLEIFWVAVTLAFLRQAWFLYDRYRSFFDGWNSKDAQLACYLLVLAALFTSGTVIGGFFGRMRLGALVVLGILVQIVWMFFLWAIWQPAVY